MYSQSETTLVGRIKAAWHVVRGTSIARPRLPDVVLTRDALVRMSRNDIGRTFGLTSTSIEGSGF